MTEHELNQVYQRLLNACRDEGLFRNCTQCISWGHEEDKCLKYNMKPPTHVIVVGCKDFQADEIPF